MPRVTVALFASDGGGMDFERGLVKTRLGYIHYRATGQGRPVMLFHINQQSSALMRELMQALSPSCRVVAMDYPSHGHSDPIDFQPSFDDYRECAVAVMDSLDIRTAAVMGEAVGAGLSVAMATAHPDRIDKVVLLNCPFSPNRGQTAAHVRDLRDGRRPEDESGFPLTRTIPFVLERDTSQVPMVPSQDWMDRINTTTMEVGRRRWQAVTALSHFSVADGLARMTQPTMLILGEHFYYSQYADQMVAAIRDLRGHTILPNARFCISWEKAAEIANLAGPFLTA